MSDDMSVMAAREQICHIGRLGAGMWHHTCTKTHKELVLKVKRTPFFVLCCIKTNDANPTSNRTSMDNAVALYHIIYP